MVFSSPIFLFVFLPIILIGYFLIRTKYKNLFLLGASLLFYCWGEPKYVLLMLVSILLNYIFGILVENNKNKGKLAKKITGLAVVVNLGILILYKYANFIIDNLNVVAQSIGFKPIYLEPIDLPIGISFYTFQAMSYVIDVYRRDTVAQRKLSDHALYISLFPQLVAGPIVRYSDISEQIKNRKTTIEDFEYGIRRFIIGLGKKVLIANPLGRIADDIFSLSGENLSSSLSWFGLICYSFQIYYDFSGYSDMAIGLGRMFGFKFLENFNYPYISKSIKEFWRRWHISLSSWFRDYVYIPLGGSRSTVFVTYRNLIIVFLLTGIWHGASWNFIVWGLFHGLFLLLERTRFGNLLDKIWSPIKLVYTLFVVMIGWVFFKSETFGSSVIYLKAMFNLYSNNISNLYNVSMFINNEILLVLCIAIIGATPIPKKMVNKIEHHINKKKSIVLKIGYESLYIASLIALLLFSVMSLATSTYNPFIYFRF
ncbi:MBOAT family O-acyltransferase [Paenibacillus woosongensis]|uniref:MBOAT family O-acyltransferase n=1 Tax=Paenibacillus woosongensis TaxID=307580 RepID=A0AA95I8U8_9BACL|nr:MBOAT family O-acyltransferase [Paenibacillus woosongensis]WHX48662.1 MBOAT family O-acyltransferase [Paenibacillus woosongensis]